jgi:hypothetical protein
MFSLHRWLLGRVRCTGKLLVHHMIYDDAVTGRVRS